MQMGIFYFVSPRVTRSLAYGLAARNRLDMYRPPAKRKRPPNGYRVVIYITGSETCCFRSSLCSKVNQRSHIILFRCHDGTQGKTCSCTFPETCCP